RRMTESNQAETGNGGAPGHARHGKLGYLEIPAVDVSRSARFYEALFGWRVEIRDTTSASFDDGTGELIGHWVTERQASRKPGFLPYIYVADLRTIIDRARDMGSEIVDGPRPEGGLIVASLSDPAGNIIGIWQEA